MQNPIVEISARAAPVSIRWDHDGGYFRETRAPGADLSDLPADVREPIEAHWAPAVVDQWTAEQAALAAEAPSDPMPELTPRQLRLMLLQLSLTEASIIALIDAIEDEGERAAALIEWNWATRYERSHPLVAQLASAMDFTPEELDALWRYAADL